MRILVTSPRVWRGGVGRLDIPLGIGSGRARLREAVGGLSPVTDGVVIVANWREGVLA